jgi:hypothetical protein
MRAAAIMTGKGRLPTDGEMEQQTQRAYAAIGKRHKETLSKQQFMNVSGGDDDGRGGDDDDGDEDKK